MEGDRSMLRESEPPAKPGISGAPAPPQEGRFRGTAIVFVIVGVGLAGFLGLRVKQALVKREAIAQERKSAQEAALAKPKWHAAEVTPTKWRPRIELTGTLRPWREADLGFETGGRLVQIRVAVGDKVEQGAALAVLDASLAGAQVSHAEAGVRAAAANLALAEDQLKRTEALAAQKAIPEAQAEQARQQAALAKAQLESATAQAQLARTGAGLHTIRAPFRGVVTRAPTAAGGVVGPGVPLIHLEDTARLRLSATVSEDDAPLVKVGALALVTYRERVVQGRVSAVVPSLDPATRRAPIEVEVQNDPASPLLAWSFVRARIEGMEEVDAVRVPVQARRPGAQDEVVKLEGKKARVVHVAHVVDDDGSWIVRSGLAAGDRVVLNPDPETKDGEEIEIEGNGAAAETKK
jgi:RND family efflux transporter MFP subunit